MHSYVLILAKIMLFVAGLVGQFKLNWFAPYEKVAQITCWIAMFFGGIDLVMPAKINVKDKQGNKALQHVSYTNQQMIMMAALCVAFMAIIFQYTLPRGLKDSMIVGQNGGVVALSAIKLLTGLFVIPGLQILYGKIFRHRSLKETLLWIMGILIAFYVLFIVLFVAKDGNTLYKPSIIPSHSTAVRLFGWLPGTISRILIPLSRNWPSIIFYTFAELIGTILLSSFFTTMITFIIKTFRVKGLGVSISRLTSVTGQMGTLAAATFGEQYVSERLAVTPWSAIQFVAIWSSIAAAIVIVFSYIAIDIAEQEKLLEQPITVNDSGTRSTTTTVNEPVHLSTGAWYAVLAAMVQAICTALSEPQQKSCLKATAMEQVVIDGYSISGPDAQTRIGAAYHKLLSQTLETQSLLAYVLGLLVPELVSRFAGLKWQQYALIPSVVTAGAMLIVFGLPILNECTNLALSARTQLFLSSIAFVAIKVSKYTFFDPCRERFASTLSAVEAKECKNTESLLAKLSKTGSSILVMTLAFIGLREGSVGFLLGLSSVSFASVGVWIYSVIRMGESMKDVVM
jgi:ATP/ADP translocase